MPAVGRRTQTNRNARNERADSNAEELDNLDAALLQTFIAKRVLHLDNALDIFGTLIDATGEIS
jgi:hypothetical protein